MGRASSSKKKTETTITKILTKREIWVMALMVLKQISKLQFVGNKKKHYEKSMVEEKKEH